MLPIETGYISLKARNAFNEPMVYVNNNEEPVCVFIGFATVLSQSCCVFVFISFFSISLELDFRISRCFNEKKLKIDRMERRMKTKKSDTRRHQKTMKAIGIVNELFSIFLPTNAFVCVISAFHQIFVLFCFFWKREEKKRNDRYVCMHVSVSMERLYI